MIGITEQAESLIGALMEEHGEDASGIRIYLAQRGPSGPQFGIGFQEERWEGDLEDRYEKFSLYYDEETGSLLDGALIDCMATEEGPMLVLQLSEGDEGQ